MMLRSAPGPPRLSGFEAAVPSVGSTASKKQQAEAKKHCEDALETFLAGLPSWRCGQRDAGRFASESPERVKAEKEKARRPSPVASSRKGNFDKGPGQQVAPPPQKALTAAASRSRSRSRSKRSRGRRRDKEKDRDRKKDRSRDRSRDKDKKRGKDKKKREKSESSKSASPPRKAKKSPSPSPAKEKEKEKSDGKGVPSWLADIVPDGGGFSAMPTGAAPGVVPPQQPKKEVIVPQQFVSRLIGKGGESIMGICHQTGADVKIRQETKEMGYSVAVITGRPDTILKAEQLVLERLGAVSDKMGTVPVPRM